MLQLADEAATKYRAKVVFLMPAPSKDGLGLSFQQTERYVSSLKEALTNKGIDFLDYRDRSAPDRLKDRVHLNLRGAAEAASLVLDYISNL